MLIKHYIAGLFLLIPFFSIAQFPPPAGQEGSTAIHCDSSIFIDWASGCIIERGYIDISNPSSGVVSYGNDSVAIAKADNIVVSLGDAGTAILTFNTPVANGSGYDFAVFENSFSDTFLELGFVEVSSNGTDFFPFESTSLTDTETQVGTFGSVDATKINNLAGKYRAYYGTPFDLEELKDISNLDINNIIAIKITDVVGSIDPDYASYDSQGNMVNDPWPTSFYTGGMDLDAIGVINNRNNTYTQEIREKLFTIYPVPAKNIINISSNSPVNLVNISSLYGEIIYSGNTNTINISNFKSGIYIITIYFETRNQTQKFIIQ